ncbi:hypothetical protein EXIGLDRAFT_430283 [Exidia glandulosa HHB12029]|uniref:Uncharacterized protein n=1 Tax=Exidia glandulosa HHB12029 TaxID=1314781 RepID=A0A165BAY8_EXIGL|nr:hypothetical protein EXIGLDRAFT_430283 [Exidia glandulosa HHB12029]
MGIYSRTSNSRYYTRSAFKLKSFTRTCTMSFKSKLSRRRSALKHKQFHKVATASAIRKRSIARKLYKACHRVANAHAMHAARPAPVPTLVTRSIPQVRGFLVLQVTPTSSGKRKRTQREHVSPASSPISPHGAARSPAESEASTSRATLDVEPRSPRSQESSSFSLFPASGDNASALRSSSRFDTPEPEEIQHVHPVLAPVPVPAPAPTPKPMASLLTRVPYRQPAPPPVKSSSSKSSQPKRRRLANAYKEGVIKSALRRALLAHHRSSSSSPVGVGLSLVAGVLARARAAMGVTSSSASQPTLPVPPSTSSRSIFAPIPTPMPLPAKGTPPSSNTQRGVLRPRKRLQLGPWLVLVERRMKLRQVLSGKGKQVVPLPKLRTGLSVPAAKDVKQVLRREGSALVAC